MRDKAGKPHTVRDGKMTTRSEIHLFHLFYVIRLGPRIREQPIWMFLLICIPTLALLSVWGGLLEKATNTLVNKLASLRKSARV